MGDPFWRYGEELLDDVQQRAHAFLTACDPTFLSAADEGELAALQAGIAAGFMAGCMALNARGLLTDEALMAKVNATPGAR